jgi:PilZ domain
MLRSLMRLFDANLERRHRRRLRADVDVILSGSCGQAVARGVDLSRSGMGVLASQSLEVGTLVFLRIPECDLMGFAFVRRCVMQPEGIYLMGLEFRGGLTRDGSDHAVRPDPGAWHYRVAHSTCAAWNAADDA